MGARRDMLWLATVPERTVGWRCCSFVNVNLVLLLSERSGIDRIIFLRLVRSITSSDEQTPPWQQL